MARSISTIRSESVSRSKIPPNVLPSLAEDVQTLVQFVTHDGG